MKIVLGSKNPVKIAAVKQAFAKFYPEEALIEVIGQSAPSGVPDQPMSHEDTITGALNRAKYCREHFEGDYFVGLEGGIADFPITGEKALTSWAAVVGKNSGEKSGIGGGEMLILPEELCELLAETGELGPAADIYFKKKNVRENEGTIGALTKGIISRSDWFTGALVIALSTYNND